MSNSPQYTAIKRPRPKAQLFKWFDRKPSQRKSFEEDVTRLEFATWIASHTLPAIAEGENIKKIFVIKIAEGNILAEHIRADEEHARIIRQIEAWNAGCDSLPNLAANRKSMLKFKS